MTLGLTLFGGINPSAFATRGLNVGLAEALGATAMQATHANEHNSMYLRTTRPLLSPQH
jgi:hypothetical protein